MHDNHPHIILSTLSNLLTITQASLQSNQAKYVTSHVIKTSSNNTNTHTYIHNAVDEDQLIQFDPEADLDWRPITISDKLLASTSCLHFSCVSIATTEVGCNPTLRQRCVKGQHWRPKTRARHWRATHPQDTFRPSRKSRGDQQWLDGAKNTRVVHKKAAQGRQLYRELLFF